LGQKYFLNHAYMLPTVDEAVDCCNQLSLQADMRSRRVRRQVSILAILVLACFTYVTAAMEGNLTSLRKLKDAEQARTHAHRPIVLKTPSGNSRLQRRLCFAKQQRAEKC